MKPCIILTCLLLTAATSAFAERAPAARESVKATTMRGKQDFRPLGNALTLVEEIDGLVFHWAVGKETIRDVGAFPSDDLATSLPELLEWEIPGQAATGMRMDRVTVLLVEAVKEVYQYVDQLYQQVEQLANNLDKLTDRVAGHDEKLETHTAQIEGLTQRLAGQEELIAALKVKTTELEQANYRQDQEIAELKKAVAQLKLAMAAMGL